MKKTFKINESQLRRMIVESIEDVLGGGIDIGQELQQFLQDNKYKLFNRELYTSLPDYLRN